ncbi:MAG: two-component sensor histidine kinase, partial [Burkholderiaceae bacterium]|nr:two-component sensor histidine kinase [Burkholderiaceae bacterium]
ARLSASLDRMDRLVTQMLALSRLESTLESGAAPVKSMPVNWTVVVEQAMSDCLAVAERRNIELACDWPPQQADALPTMGDENLLTVLLRNLLDNAVRYAPPGTLVSLGFFADRLEVENEGEPLSEEQRARMGERFRRLDGQHEFGSGLGISIVQRIAALHSLTVEFGARADGRGVRAVVRRAAAAR